MDALLTFPRSCHNLNGRVHLIHVSLSTQYVTRDIWKLLADVISIQLSSLVLAYMYGMCFMMTLSHT